MLSKDENALIVFLSSQNDLGIGNNEGVSSNLDGKSRDIPLEIDPIDGASGMGIKARALDGFIPSIMDSIDGLFHAISKSSHLRVVRLGRRGVGVLEGPEEEGAIGVEGNQTAEVFHAQNGLRVALGFGLREG